MFATRTKRRSPIRTTVTVTDFSHFTIETSKVLLSGRKGFLEPVKYRPQVKTLRVATSCLVRSTIERIAFEDFLTPFLTMTELL